MDSIDNKYLPASLRKRYEAGAFLGKGAAGEVRLVYEKVVKQLPLIYIFL